MQLILLYNIYNKIWKGGLGMRKKSSREPLKKELDESDLDNVSGGFKKITITDDQLKKGSVEIKIDVKGGT